MLLVVNAENKAPVFPPRVNKSCVCVYRLYVSFLAAHYVNLKMPMSSSCDIVLAATTAQAGAKESAEMPLTSATVCNMSGFMVGFIAFVLLMSEILPLFSNNTLVVEEIWTAEDLSSMAGSSTMAAAVGYLTSVSARSRAFEREYDE